MSYISSQSKIIHTRGFTLVEMLIVLGLFSFIMTLATGVLYTTQAVNTKLQETQAVLDNVNVSMDILSHDIRYGTDFHCGVSSTSTADLNTMTLRKSCSYRSVGDSHGGQILYFKPVDAMTDSDRVAYYASSTALGDVIFKTEYFGGSTTTYRITANDVRIRSLVFYVDGANTTSGVGVDVNEIHDYAQPLISVTISGETIPIKNTASSTSFIIQTSISSRGIDK